MVPAGRVLLRDLLLLLTLVAQLLGPGLMAAASPARAADLVAICTTDGERLVPLPGDAPAPAHSHDPCFCCLCPASGKLPALPVAIVLPVLPVAHAVPAALSLAAEPRPAGRSWHRPPLRGPPASLV